MAEEIKRNVPRDLFLHLLAIVTLYWSSVTFVGILWQFINKFFPDVLWYGEFGRVEMIRFFVSSLIIVFPVFLLVSWYLNKIYSKEAVVRESKIRKWLIYLTLFVASLVIIVDLVTTINTLMQGEITVRFILKALSVLLVAGIIFWYYLDDVRRETPTKLAKYFAWVTGVLVLVVVIGGIIIAGTPATARLQQFDQQKISDLTGIQWEIVRYWQSKQVMPSSLSNLNDKISGYTAPFDPQTKQPYEYVIIDATNLSFQLCATFNKPMKDPLESIVSRNINQTWDHDAGRVCFERTIDRQLYPPLNTVK